MVSMCISLPKEQEAAIKQNMSSYTDRAKRNLKTQLGKILSSMDIL
jgi:hypothetical protein